MVVAAVVVVALIAIAGGALAQLGDKSPSPSADPSPSASSSPSTDESPASPSPTPSTTTSPTATPTPPATTTAAQTPPSGQLDGFPLDAGWPADRDGDFSYDAPSGDNQAQIPAGELDACKASPSAEGSVDRLTTRLNGPAEFRGREIQEFESGAAAAAYVASVRNVLAECPRESDGAQGYIDTAVAPTTASEDSFVATWTMTRGIGRGLVAVVRVEDLVVVEVAADEGTDAAALSTEVHDQLRPVIEAMSEPEAAPGNVDSLRGPIPADFPLDHAFPTGSDFTITPPTTDASVIGDVDYCWVKPSPLAPDREGQLFTSVTGPEYGDGRALYVLRDADTAVRILDQVRDRVQACADARDGEVWTVHDHDTGYDSVTFSLTYEQGLGASWFQLTRVGRGLLMTISYGEGSLASAESELPSRTRITRALAGSMCVFTAAGC